MEKRRVEAFSDGVFAIAMTLLVLAIVRPSVSDPESLASQLRGGWPSYLAYVTTFLQLAIVWTNHHEVFDHIRRADPWLLLLNNLFLMVVCFSPFSAGIVADFLSAGRDETTAVVFFGLTFTLMAVMFSALWYYAAFGNRLIDPSMRASAARITRRFAPGVPIYLLGTAVALIDPVASLIVFAALALLYAIPYRRDEPPEAAAAGDA